MAAPAPKRRTKKVSKKNINKEYYEEIEYICPVRGRVKQKVKVTKLNTKIIDVFQAVSSKSELDKVKDESVEDLDISDD